MKTWPCRNCWTPKLHGEDQCFSCTRHPGMTDKYLSHPITCKFGFSDCIHDPGYIFANYPDWYEELYGNKDIADAAKEKNGCGMCTEKHCQYDDEDK